MKNEYFKYTDKNFLKDQEIEPKKERREDKGGDDLDKMNRRDFLKKALVTGAVIATGDLLPKKLSEYEAEKNLAKSVFELEEEKMERGEKIVAEMFRTYESPEVAKRFDPEVFTDDYVLAQIYQESRYDKDAVSPSGARGILQNKSESIEDVVKFLKFLRDKKGVDYKGPEEITEEMAKEICYSLNKKDEYGLATGKLYSLYIHDKESVCNTGKNKDVFRGKSPEEQQKILLLAYHDGPSRRRNPKKASKKAKKYVELVFKHKKIIKDMRNRLERAGMPRDLDRAIVEIMKKLEDKENKENNEKKEDTINYWLKKLQDKHIALWKMTGNYNKKLGDDEICSIFQKDEERA